MEAASNRSGGCSRPALIRLTVIAGGVVLFAALIAAFYLEEDCRGAAALKKAEAQTVARGISLSRDDYVPRPPPAAQNFGALPIFAIEPDRKAEWQPAMQRRALKTAFGPFSRHHSFSATIRSLTDTLPVLGTWYLVPVPDSASLRDQIVHVLQVERPRLVIDSKAGPVQLFGQLCPALADLRAANKERPLCVFPQDYDVEPPLYFSFTTSGALLQPAQALRYEAQLALVCGDPQLALDDLAVNRKLMMGLQREPFLVSGLCAAALARFQALVVQQGLAGHVWNDAQLRQLDADLGSTDFLASACFWIKGDYAAFSHPVYRYYRSQRGASNLELAILEQKYLSTGDAISFWERARFQLVPNGWFDLDMAKGHSDLAAMLKLIDLPARLVRADQASDVANELASEKSWVFWGQPLNPNPRIAPESVRSFAFAQAQIDEGRIACRLERYRLVHGAYPASLQVIEEPLPHDPMSGEPYRYQLRPDGTYILYSVGWNQKDDHGKGDLPPDGTLPDESDDWVWVDHTAYTK